MKASQLLLAALLLSSFHVSARSIEDPLVLTGFRKLSTSAEKSVYQFRDELKYTISGKKMTDRAEAKAFCSQKGVETNLA